MPKTNAPWLHSETLQLTLLVIATAAIVALLKNHLTAKDALVPAVAAVAALARIAKGKDK